MSRLRSLAGKVSSDSVVCLLVFAGTVAYLAAMPRDLGLADESYFLVEAKRILHSEMLYRDIFWFAMPLAHWIMAAIFWIFGTDMLVARLAMAVLHGAIASLLFLICRHLGVRTGIALSVAAAHVTLCQAPWPYASPHWFDTLLITLLLFVLVSRPAGQLSGRALLSAGIVVGLLASVHQHIGAVFAAAMGLYLVADSWLSRRYGTEQSAAGLLSQLRSFSVGVLLVLVPVFLVMVVTAGVRPLYEQLLVHPLTGYRKYNHSDWCEVNLMTLRFARYTWPVVLKYVPAVVVIGLARAVRNWFVRADREQFRNLLALLIVCPAAALSISYLPDFIHVGFIAPLFFVFCAETLEAVVRSIGAAVGYPNLVGRVVGASLLAALALHLRSNMALAYGDFPLSHQTAFGRVDFATADEVRLVDEIRSLMGKQASRKFFAYPVYTSLYLMTDTDNPTRHQVLIPDYNSAEEVQGALATIRALKLPYIVASKIFLRDDDPIFAYVRREYECFYPRDPEKCLVYRRRQAP